MKNLIRKTWNATLDLVANALDVISYVCIWNCIASVTAAVVNAVVDSSND